MWKSTFTSVASSRKSRGGSTLVIVIALLGLLSFLGIVFFFFASQERASSEYFSESAKFAIEDPPNVFDHMLRHVIVGPKSTPNERLSILFGGRHSMLSNMYGSDLAPYSGKGIGDLNRNGNGVPVSPLDYNSNTTDWLEFVDSPFARVHQGYTIRGNEATPITLPPEPDVDYTSPDINTLFLAYRGTAIQVDRSTGNIQQVPVIIPSFLRPQYLKSAILNYPTPAAGTLNVPTDPDWMTSNRYPARSFRPSPQHIAGRLPNGTPVFRYVSAAEAAGLGLADGFPFVPLDYLPNGSTIPHDPNSNGVFGEMGVWTGSPNGLYELDVDNDGDGTGDREGIWMDLHFPLQETASGQQYVVLHSMTIYDLDSLINLNVHGNIAAINRLGDLTNAGAGLVQDGNIQQLFISRSNQGLGPNEINPEWALRRGVPPGTNLQFTGNYGRMPVNEIEQANMEWLWLVAGRAEYPGPKNVLPGRWGEAEKAYKAFASTKRVGDLPRAGSSGDSFQSISNGIRFGGNYSSAGRIGYDDNGDALEGEFSAFTGRIWPFRHPLDYSGAGRTNSSYPTGYAGGQFAITGNSPLKSLLHHSSASTGPERWLQYYGYAVNRDMPTGTPRYIFGQNATHDQGLATSDDLNIDPNYDPLLDDMLETIFDPDYAQNKFDQIFSASDLIELHLPASMTTADSLSDRLSQLAPFALEKSGANTIRDRFTTLSNSIRRFPMSHDLGADLKQGTADDGPRAWEHTADTDGADQDNDGYADGDNPLGTGEFPPKFGSTPTNGKPYSATDPFRPQVRRLLTHEVGDSRAFVGQLPISLNHILDVERNAQTPDELSQPVQFLRYMQRAGLRFRQLTEHPSATEGNTVLQLTTVPTYDPSAPVAYPPKTPEQREYWARRDRQKLCRDIFVLLYTTGGTQRTGTNIRDYRLTNDPSAAEGTALYSHRQLREMAQFAVNVVDAMDSDDVVTKFEYDKNLGPDSGTTGGWNLDDDPYTMEETAIGDTAANFAAVTDNGRYREDGLARGVVYGVEAQQVSIAEVLAVGALSTAATTDNVLTLDNDTAVRSHLFVELQNVGPTPVKLSTSESKNMDSAIWRIVRHDRKTAGNLPIGGTGNQGRPYRAVGFKDAAALNQTISGGERFVISTASDNNVASSDLFVDYDGDSTFELIAPSDPVGTLPTTMISITDPAEPSLKPRADLDLIHDDHASGFVMDNDAGTASTTKGDFLANLAAYAGNDSMVNLRGGTFSGVSAGFDLVLQRRANTNLPSVDRGPVASRVAGEDPNPWIDVDYFRVEFRDLGIQDGDTTAQLQGSRLPGIGSYERVEPLDDGTRSIFSGAATSFRYNTVGLANSNAPSVGYQLWQAHFDRDFASPGELLNVPLFPPMHLTQMLDRTRYSPYHQAFDSLTAPSGDPKPALLASASAKFLQADFPPFTSGSETANDRRTYDNSWFRLFRFVEVPSRVHRMLGNYVSLDRVPGKLNLNTLRHWEVYAGLIDNPGLLDKETTSTAQRVTVDRSVNESGNPVNRDRWREFLEGRDGVTLTASGGTAVDLIAPGTLQSKPFRSHGFEDVTVLDGGIQSTILRQDPKDVGAGNLAQNRHWLEVASRIQHEKAYLNNADLTKPNAVQQHQLLSKILNNTTSTSNTFIVFATVGYFEAVESPAGSGMIRIGSRIDLNLSDGKPPFDGDGWRQRAVFVIDRTEAAKAYDSASGSIDWSRLVKARITIED
ncbi:MAG: hypothetical protein U0996_07640 [Planctomycetaceae bacterium]